MKKSKKFLSILLAISMILAMSVSAFAAEEPTHTIKPLEVYVVDGDGVQHVETIAAEDRIMPRMTYYTFSKMDYDTENVWVLKGNEQIPNQSNGGKTLASRQHISEGDDCIGAYIYSDTIDTVNIKIEWSGGSTYFWNEGLSNHDVVVYFRANDTNGGGDALVMNTRQRYSVVASTMATWGGEIDIQVCPGVYTG